MRKERSMLQGPLLVNVLFYTIPIMLTSVLQLFFNAADLVVIGQFRGSLSVAAVGATGAITNLIVNLFIGLSVGAGVVVGIGLGAKDDEAVHKAVHTTLPTALICGVILTGVGVAMSEKFLQMMGTPEDILPLSAKYMQVYFGGISFTMVYNFCASILRAVGDTRSPLMYLTGAGVINVILNIIFVSCFGMDVEGVALATVVSQAIAAVLVVRALTKRSDACRLSLGKMRIYMPQLIKIIRIGLPAGIQSSLFAISNVIIQSSINSFGAVVMSGDAAAKNLDGFLYVIINSFSHTAVNFTAQNVGAGQYKRARKTLWCCLACSGVLGAVAAVALLACGPTLLGLYITDSAESIHYGMVRLMIIGLPYFICGLMDATTGALRGMGASLVPMLICILGVCGIRLFWIAVIFTVPRFHSVECIYLSYPISWTITFVVQLAAFFMVYKRRSAVHELKAL